MSQYIQLSDGSHAVQTSLTGRNAGDAQTLWTPGMLYNETTSDKPRGNTQGTLLASAARTASPASPNQTNYNGKGVIAYLHVTAAPASPGAGGLQLSVMGLDTLSNNTIRFGAIPTTITTAGFYGYVVYPGATSNNAGFGYVQQALSSILPRTWLVYVNHLDTQSYTYSVGYSLIL